MARASARASAAVIPTQENALSFIFQLMDHDEYFLHLHQPPFHQVTVKTSTCQL